MRHPEGNLCIDPVEPSEAVLDQIVGTGATRILLTNRNHTRAANLLRSRLGARTAIHPKDADYARSQGAEIDDTFDVGERIGPLQVIGIPGKSPGEVGLFWQERKLLIVGDAVIGNPPGRCGLLPEKVMDDPVQLKQSLQAVLVLDFDTLLMGDGSPIVSHGKDRLNDVRFRRARARHRREKGGDASRHDPSLLRLCCRRAQDVTAGQRLDDRQAR